MKFKDKDGYTHEWVTLLPALKYAYSSSKHSSTKMTPYELEKGWIPNMPRHAVLNKSVVIKPTSKSFYDMITKAQKFASKCVEDAVEYNKHSWDKTHKMPDFKVGDQVLVSTVNFNNCTGARKLKDSFVGPFVIKQMNVPNAAEVIRTGELERKHPTFPVSWLKHYKSADRTLFPDRNIQVRITPLEKEEEKKIQIILDSRIIRKNGKDTREFLCRFRNRPADEDEWRLPAQIPDADKLLRSFKASKKNITS